MKIDAQQQPAMFFILGRGRSGTWLLQSILEQHPLLNACPEALFLISLKQKYSVYTSWKKPLLNRFLQDLWEEKRLATWWKLEFEQLEEVIMQFEGEYSFARICQAVYQLRSLKTGKPENTITGDKNPTYTLFIPELMELFPQARFICMVRDFRDNILSFQKASFDLNRTASLAQRWVGYNREILRFNKLFPEQFLVVKYEDFLLNPEKELTSICQFLSVEFHEGLLEFYKKERKLEAWQQNLDKPLDSTRINAWHGKMDKRDVAIAELLCGNLAVQFGYELSNQGGVSKIWARPGQLIGGLFNWLEKHFFNIPFPIRTHLLNVYRKVSKTA